MGIKQVALAGKCKREREGQVQKVERLNRAKKKVANLEKPLNAEIFQVSEY